MTVVDPTAEFEHWLTISPPRLDRLGATIARHVRPDLTSDHVVAELDALARRCPASSGLEICTWLVDDGFGGPVGDYYDPENSLLDSVLVTRRGIPITLSVVALEVARRLDTELVGIGLPGEFLVAEPSVPNRYAAIFRDRRPLDVPAVEALFTAIHGADARFSADYLVPVDSLQIVMRMLNNLFAIYRSRRDRRALRWVVALRRLLMTDSPTDLATLSDVAAADGRFDVAAALLEQAAATDAGSAPALLRRARALRARLN